MKVASFNKLFSPLQIRGLELKNRIVMPAMGTKFANRSVSQQLIDYHIARAKGGSGLNMVEVCSIHRPSAPKNFLAICDDSYIPGLKKLTDAIHENGGKAGLQLWQGGLAAGLDQSCMIILPSDTPVAPEVTLPGCTEETIEEIVECFGKAAKRAVEAGFDCVEVHAAHNYMIHTFLSPACNQRTDEYGGSFENRVRFPLAAIRAVRANIPDSMPMFMRIGAVDDFPVAGLTTEEVIEFCKLAKEAGVDVLDVSRGNMSTGVQFEVPPIDLPRGFNIENAARIRKETGMLTMGVGRVNDPQQAEDILAADKVDLIGMGRAQLADSEFCNKAKAGEVDDIVRCIGCNQGCFDGFANMKSPHITCLRNPGVGREAEFQLKPATSPKTVLVAGGGPAGLEAAITLKKRGHNPILCESTSRLGGQFLLAGEAPRKVEMKESAIHMGELAKRLGVDVRLSTPVTPELIAEIKPDAVFCAIGSTPITLRIPGNDLPFVCDSHDVLDGRTLPSGKVAVIGGGLVGLEAAEFLHEKGCDVTVLEMLEQVGADLGATRAAMVQGHTTNKINTITSAKCIEIKEGAVIIEKDGKQDSVPCNAVVVAIGARSRDSSALEKACRDQGIAWFEFGDAAKARRALNATAEAAAISRTFDEPKAMETARHTKKVIFLTGASGGMGLEGMNRILERMDRFRLRILVRPSPKNIAMMKDFNHHAGLEIVWGDLGNYDDVLKCVTGADYVLHVGAFVSPEADNDPQRCIDVNYGSTLSIIDAIKAQPNADDIALVYIGTVAMTGCRLPPIHWGRCGDPIKGSIFDYYAVSKIASERAVAESGLKKWVSLRQTGILPAKSVEDPIVFHQPVNNVLEWVTAIESGILLANVCEDWVPEEFWGRFYNIGGDASFRRVSWQFFEDAFAPMGLSMRDVYEPYWFTRYNFHGQWYTDSDLLNDYLKFRTMTYDQYNGGVQAEMKALFSNPMVAAMLPTGPQMKAGNEQLTKAPRGPKWMLEHPDWVKAFYGSQAEMDAMPRTWDEVEFLLADPNPTYLDHGYDESKPVDKLDISDMKSAAEFRGGKCLSSSVGGFYQPLQWQCAFGHTFEATPNLILKGGHWCPECERTAWNYGEIAARSPFFNQVWGPIHGPDETYSIPKQVNDLSLRR